MKAPCVLFLVYFRCLYTARGNCLEQMKVFELLRLLLLLSCLFVLSLKMSITSRRCSNLLLLLLLQKQQQKRRREASITCCSRDKINQQL